MLVRTINGSGGGGGESKVKFSMGGLPDANNPIRIHAKNFLITNTTGTYYLAYADDGAYTVDHNTLTNVVKFSYDASTNIFTAYRTNATAYTYSLMYEDLDA